MCKREQLFPSRRRANQREPHRHCRPKSCLFAHPRLAAVDRHHHTEIGAEIQPLPIIGIDDDRVDRDVGKTRRAGAIEASPGLAVVDAAKDMRAAEVAVGGYASATCQSPCTVSMGPPLWTV